MENNEIKLLTPEEASQKFFNGKKSYGAMVGAVRKKQLPAVRVGNRVYFDETTLKEFFLKQLRTTTAEIAVATRPQHQRDMQERNKVSGIKRID